MKPSYFYAAALAATALFLSANESLRAQCNISGATTFNSCFGYPDGEVDIAISSGTWTYQWSDGPATTQDRDDLYNNINYTVTATCVSGQCSQYCTTVTYSTSVTPASSDDWPQSTGDPGASNVDDGVVATMTDEDENVYFLGTFVYPTEIGGTAISTGNSPDYRGMWIAKFDPCGDLIWVDYSDLTEDISIKPVDFVLVDESGTEYVYVFGSIDDPANEFDLDGTNIGTPPTIDMGSGEESFLLKVAADDGDYNDYESIGTILYADELYDMEFYDDDFYVAGEDGNLATVHEIDMTGYLSQFAQDGGTGESWFTDIEFYSGVLYGVGAYIDNVAFPGSSGPTSLAEYDAFAMRKSGSSFTQGIANAGTDERAIATGLEMDANGHLIIIGNYQGTMNDWGAISTSAPNMFLLGLDAPSSTSPLFTTDGEESVSGFVSAQAIDVVINESQEITVLGSFVGGAMQFEPSVSTPRTTPGDAPNNALWIAKFNIDGDDYWITSNWSTNSENINPVALAGGPYNYFATGTFLDNINTSSNSPLAGDPNLAHPTSVGDAVFFIRYGDFNGQLSSGQVYKTASPGGDSNQDGSDEQLLRASGFQAYPNPTKNNLTVMWPLEDEGKVSISLSNIQGQTVYSKGNIAPDSEQFTIDTKTLASGVYVLKVKSAQSEWQQKIIIQ